MNEVKDAIDGVFSRKAYELDLKTGDITPDQKLTLDRNIAEIERILLEWISQNKNQILSDIIGKVKTLNKDQLEEVWCDLCGDDPKFDKGGYGDS
jgi:hypothetical protein